MAILTKFLQDFGNATGIPAIAISRTVYSAAILGYVANVAVPAWRNRNKAKDDIIDEEEKELEISRQVSLSHQLQEAKKTKGPGVNR